MANYSKRMSGLSGTATREILKLTQRPEVISFAGGMPAAECLPCEDVKRIAADVLDSDAKSILQYGQSEGAKPLVEQLIKYIDYLGLKADASMIQVVSGGQQGLDLICKTFIDPGDVILVENPTYLAFLQIAKTYQARVVGVNADDNGLVLSDLEQKIKTENPKLLYVVPTFSNPTGKTYTAENRKGIAELCKKYGVVVIEDDPYGNLRYEGEKVPLLKSFDDCGCCIYVTSFSKTIAPGLRVAFCYGASEIIRKLTICKQSTDLQNPVLCQMIIAEYLKRGYFIPNLEKAIKTYTLRQKAMLSALKKYMPEQVEYTKPQGGLFLWLTLPKHVDVGEMFGEAIAKNVAYIQGKEFYCDGSGANTMRLNFSNSDETRIDKGIAVLADIIKTKI